jgi:hypothetical protein
VIFDWSKLSDSRVTHKRDSLCLWAGAKRQFRDYAKPKPSSYFGWRFIMKTLLDINDGLGQAALYHRAN